MMNLRAESIGSANRVVTTAGTQVQLTTTSTPAVWVIITAAPANGGNITIGGPDVDGTADAESGMTLDGGQTTPLLPITDLADIWIDTSNSGDEVGYIYGAP